MIIYSSRAESLLSAVRDDEKISSDGEMKLAINTRTFTGSSLDVAARDENQKNENYGNRLALTQTFYGHGARKSESITVKCCV